MDPDAEMGKGRRGTQRRGSCISSSRSATSRVGTSSRARRAPRPSRPARLPGRRRASCEEPARGRSRRCLRRMAAARSRARARREAERVAAARAPSRSEAEKLPRPRLLRPLDGIGGTASRAPPPMGHPAAPSRPAPRPARRARRRAHTRGGGRNGVAKIPGRAQDVCSPRTFRSLFLHAAGKSHPRRAVPRPLGSCVLLESRRRRRPAECAGRRRGKDRLSLLAAEGHEESHRLPSCRFRVLRRIETK